MGWQRKMRVTKSILSVFLILCGIFFTFLMGIIVLPYFSFQYDIGFLLTKQSIINVDVWRVSFFTHISSSLFVMFFGLIQFIKSLQGKRIHKIIGKLYVILIIFFAAPSGLIMSFYANGGMAAKTSFAIISMLWWIFTYQAFIKAKQKKILLHQQYMNRSYALTLSAISLRLYVLILPLFLHLHAKEMYVLVSWLSWLPNLLIAELINYKLKRGYQLSSR